MDINGNPINAVGAPLGTGNPNNTPEVRAQVSFGTSQMSSFSVYAFSDRDSDHQLSINSSSFEVTTVPEPSAALLSVISLGALLRRRR